MSTNTFERSLYRVWRECARCRGTGAGVTCQNCVVCSGEKGRLFHLYAEELLPEEILSCDIEVQIRISIEIDALRAHNAAARAHADKNPWEDSYRIRLAGGSDAPEQTKRRVGKVPEVPSGKAYRDIRAWENYLKRMDRFEAQNSGGITPGKRSYGLRGQRLCA